MFKSIGLIREVLKGGVRAVMISCKKATELMSKAMDEELSMAESAQLKIHLFICEFCQQFKMQLEQLRKALRRMHAEGETQEHTPPDKHLPESRKARLKELVKKK